MIRKVASVGVVLLSGMFLVQGLAVAEDIKVKITPDIAEVTVKHGAADFKVMRNQDTAAVISADFAKTSRECPPFCAQPMEAAPGVKTFGEVEVIKFMAEDMAKGTGVLIDARTPDWYAKGTIPGSINIPYSDINPSLGAEDAAINDSLERVGVVIKGEKRDFSKAKNLVLWCNGPWCGQSPSAIKGLIQLGYPLDKLHYYRGGMQGWQIFGLSVAPPAK